MAFLLRHPLTHVRAGRYRTRTARAERSEGNQSPSGALISARFPTPRNVYRDDRRFVVGGTGLEQGGSDDASRQSKQSAQWAVA